MQPIQAIIPGNTEHGSEPYDPKKTMERIAEISNNAPGDENLKDGYNCELCKNRGYFHTVNERNGAYYNSTRDCKCMKTRATIRRMKRSGMKDIITDYTFQKFEATEEWQTKIKAAAVEYAKAPAGWFYIGGQSGSGKTHICTAICREILHRGREVRYMLWREEIVKIKAVANKADEYEAAIGPYKSAEVLYIDDLFKTGKGPGGEEQRPTVGDVNVAFEILNHRYNAKLPTIISSECTISDLMGIDEAVAGRIVEVAKTFSLKSDRSRNYRLKKAVEI